MRRKTILAALAGLLAIFAWGDSRLLSGHAQADMATVAATTPVLTIPQGVLAKGASTVTVPIHFEHNLRGVAAVAFSLRYDQNCLALDLQNGALKPEVVTFNLPPQFNGSASYKEDASGSRIDVVLGDYAVPLAVLPDTQGLVTVTFRTTCSPPEGTTIVAPVTFSTQPAGSYSDTLGHPLSGHFEDGAIAIKHWIPDPTPTPTPKPGPTPQINFAPIAREDRATTKLPQSVTIDVLANDEDPDGHPLSIIGVTQGGIGEVTINGNGTVTYSPTSQRSGEDRFTYTVSDGKGGLAVAAVWVTVNPANRPPEAVDDMATTDEDTPVTIDVLANDRDPDADDGLLAIGVLGAPMHGAVRQDAGGRALYTPERDYYGQDSFLYAAVDRDGGTALATVTITVRSVDDPPPVTGNSVELSNFIVQQIDSKLEVNWTTRVENSSTGYYIYRTQGTQLELGLMSLPYFGAWNRISERIEGESVSGGQYRFVDDTAQPGVLYAYMLVAIDVDDNINLFGPQAASATPESPSGEIRLPFVVRG